MSLTISTKTYAQDGDDANSARYAGPANTFSVKDVLTLSRVMPKPSGSFLGVMRPTMKFTKTVVTNATTGEKHDANLALGGSLPVGMSDADVTSLRDDMVSFLNSATGLAMLKTGKLHGL